MSDAGSGGFLGLALSAARRAARAALCGGGGRGADRDQPRRCADRGRGRGGALLEDGSHRARAVHGVDALECRSAALGVGAARPALEAHLERSPDALLLAHDRALHADLGPAYRRPSSRAAVLEAVALLVVDVLAEPGRGAIRFGSSQRNERGSRPLPIGSAALLNGSPTAIPTPSRGQPRPEARTDRRSGDRSGSGRDGRGLFMASHLRAILADQ